MQLRTDILCRTHRILALVALACLGCAGTADDRPADEPPGNDRQSETTIERETGTLEPDVSTSDAMVVADRPAIDPSAPVIEPQEQENGTSPPVSEASPYGQPACAGENDVRGNGFTRVDLAGREMIYVPVTAPRGVLLLLHGGHGSASVWENATEHRIVVRDAIAEGLMPVAITATNATRMWDLYGYDHENDDVAFARDALAYLETAGLVTPGIPLFAIGYSRGGSFVGRLTQSLPLLAVATVNSGSNAAIIRRPELSIPPFAFVVSRNDHMVESDNVAETHRQLAARGIATELYWNEPSPVTATRLSRIELLSCGDAMDVQAQLAAEGFINAGGYLTQAPYLRDWDDTFTGPAAAVSSEIRKQLGELYGGHDFSADYVGELMNFLTRYL